MILGIFLTVEKIKKEIIQYEQSEADYNLSNILARDRSDEISKILYSERRSID